MKKQFRLNQWHLFTLKDTYFVFVTTNLRLYKIDAETYENLKKIQDEYGFTDVFEQEEDEFLSELADEEMAVCVSDEMKNKKPETDDIKKAKTSDENTTAEKIYPNTTNVVLQLANDCNLNCIYCYGDGGSYGRKRELMTFETAKKSIDFLVKNSGDLKEVLVTFFGGEPLMNFSVIKQTVEYCKTMEAASDKKFAFNMTTNGTILNDEIYNFIKENKISVMLSMDGGEEIQDCYRCYADGKGSYDAIAANVARFKETRGGYLSARATVCRPNLNLKQIKDDLEKLGFTNVFMSIVDTRSDSPLFVGDDSREELLKSYLELAEDYINDVKAGKKVSSKHFESMIKALYFKNIKIRSCNAGNNGLAVGTNGSLYPCHRFMGMEEYIVGNIDNGIDRSKTEAYKYSNVLFKEDCKDCWARFLCGGACMHTCVTQENDIMKAPKCYCDTYKGLYEIVFYIYWTLKEWNNDVFRAIMEKAEDTVATVK